jgi:hypothetical protein
MTSATYVLREGWRPVESIPKDRPIEVEAPPHSESHGSMVVVWDDNKPYRGLWRWADRQRGGLMVPIQPIAWREV